MRPVAPASADALASAWMRAQSSLPQGWWVALLSEYGATAWWVARAKVPQDADGLDWLEASADTPEAALEALASTATEQRPPAWTVRSLTPPPGVRNSSSLADAWRVAEAALPRGWWIAVLDGYEGTPDAPGWIATAAGGPDAGYDGVQGLGGTLEEALRALARSLAKR